MISRSLPTAVLALSLYGLSAHANDCDGIDCPQEPIADECFDHQLIRNSRAAPKEARVVTMTRGYAHAHATSTYNSACMHLLTSQRVEVCESRREPVVLVLVLL